MADETKYGKYFASGPKPRKKPNPNASSRLPRPVLWTDDDVIKGSFVFCALRMGASFVPPSHGPHTHRDPEILAVLGTNPDDPFDLEGAEIDVYMGPEMELHTITKSTLIYIPADFLHCPMHYRNVEKVVHPIIFIQAQYSPKLNEKSFKELVKEPERDRLIFFDLEGNETEEEWDRQRAELKLE